MNIKLSEVQNLLVSTTVAALNQQVAEIESLKKKVGTTWRSVLNVIGEDLGVDLPPNTQIVEAEPLRYELMVPEESPEEADCEEPQEAVLSEA